MLHAKGKANRRDGLAATVGITVVKSFESSIFSGASVKTSSHTVDSLEALPDVLRVWPNTKVYLNPEEASVTDDLPTPQNYTTHNATGVSKLHEAGIFGKGVKVGIVDTGTW